MYYAHQKAGCSAVFNIILVSLISLCPLQALAGEGFFLSSPEEAFSLAEKTKQDVLIIFGAPYCKYCVVMKNDIISNIEVLENMLICYVDVEQREDLQKQYNVTTLPDYMVYKNRVEKKRRVGYTGFAPFRQWLGR